VVQVIDGLKVTDDPVRHLRLIRLHGRHALDRGELFASREWKEAANTVLSYAPDPEMELNLV